MSGKTGLTPSKLWQKRVTEKSILYYLQGNTTLQAVADKIGEEIKRKPSISMISKHISAAIKQWEKQNSELIEKHKYIELAKIDNLEATYWDAWYRSLQPQRVIQERKTPIALPDGRQTKKAVKYQVNEVVESFREGPGDPKFLTGVEWCINKRLEVLGNIAPQVIEANITGAITTNTTIRQIVLKTARSAGKQPLISEEQSFNQQSEE